jgi:hypothetical protein
MCVYVFDSGFQRVSSSALILKPSAYEIFELFLLNRSFFSSDWSSSAATGFFGPAGVSVITISI